VTPGSGGARAGPRPDDAGSAVVEFVTLGMLLLLPLVYLVITVGRIQAASFAADGSAREAARAFITARSEAEGERRAAEAVRLGLADQGFDAGDAELGFECTASPCLEPGARVTARVDVQVVLPGIPAFAERAVPLRVTVRAAHVAVVDVFRPRASRR
jgi:hypothetical protein